MSAEECVRIVLKGVAAQKFEVAAGGKELMGLKLKRFLPMMFEKVLRKRSGTAQEKCDLSWFIPFCWF